MTLRGESRIVASNLALFNFYSISVKTTGLRLVDYINSFVANCQ